ANIAFHSHNRNKSLDFFNLSPDKKTLLVIGGSLGAKTINESIRDGVEELGKNQVQVIWQTGKTHYDEMKATGRHPHIRIFDFIREMNLAYDAADVIISRAGAIAISELCLVKKPVILVPSPNVAEDHQTKNAMSLVEKNAAQLIKDEQAERVLVPAVLKLLQNKEKQIIYSDNITKLGKPNAAKEIAGEVMKLIGVQK